MTATAPQRARTGFSGVDLPQQQIADTDQASFVAVRMYASEPKSWHEVPCNVCMSIRSPNFVRGGHDGVDEQDIDLAEKMSSGSYRSGQVQQVHPSTVFGAIFQLIRRSEPHKNPKVLGIGFLWLFGLYAIFLSPAPVSLTDDRLQKYQEKLSILEKAEKPRLRAEQKWMDAEMDVRAAKVWFWRFKSEARQKVYKKMEKAKVKRKEFDVYDRASAKKFSDAKAELGLWSDAGVSEGRQLFWNSFEKGKVFGRRQTFWDGLMTLLTSREEGLLGMLIQFIFQAMINFTTGMVASAFIFLFSLPSMLWSYQASIIGGTLFFFVAMTGAVSVIVSFLAAMYGAGAGAVYALSTISPNSRIGAGRRGRPGYIHTRGYHQD